MVFAAEMESINATKYGTCGVAPPVATCPPGLVRVGKHCARFSLAHLRTDMLGAAESDVPAK